MEVKYKRSVIDQNIDDMVGKLFVLMDNAEEFANKMIYFDAAVSLEKAQILLQNDIKNPGLIA